MLDLFFFFYFIKKKKKRRKLKTKLGPIFCCFRPPHVRNFCCAFRVRNFCFVYAAGVCLWDDRTNGRGWETTTGHTLTHQKNIQQLKKKKKKTASERGGVSFGYSIFVVVVYPPFCFGFFIFFTSTVHFREILLNRVWICCNYFGTWQPVKKSRKQKHQLTFLK